jgi:hypothetical protein
MSTSAPERPAHRHPSPASSSTANSYNDQTNPSPDQRHISTTANDHSPSNSSSRHARNANARRSGGFLLRPAVAYVDTERNGSTHKALSHLNGFLGSKGKQRASTHKDPPRSHPAEPLGNGPALSNTVHQSDEELRQSTDSADWRHRVSSDSATREDENDIDMEDETTHPSRSALDANAIVSMALNLSEGRRRHVSGSQLMAPQAGRNSRVVSTGAPGLNYSYASGVGGSLRRHLQDQRRISRSSPLQGDRTSFQSPISSLIPSTLVDPSPSGAASDITVNVSPATLARVEKARKYIELSLKYRQLLSHLPPLKHRPETSQATDDEFSQPQQLGRMYNPIQLIRNRKARARARLQLEPEPDAWEDVDVVENWIGQVEKASSKKDYVQGDEALLPRFSSGRLVPRPGSSDSPTSKTRLGGIKPERHRIDWYIPPTEYLADAYWLEHDQHKTIVEDSHGNKLFPAVQGAITRFSRPSLDSQNSYQPSARMSLGSEQSVESDIEKPSESGGRGRALHHDHDASGRFKHVWHKARGRSSSASSGLSYSDDETGNRSKRSKMQHQSTLDSTGHLERHSSNMLHVQASPEGSHSPLISPGTPNKWGLEPKLLDNNAIPDLQIVGINDIITTPEDSLRNPEDYTRKLGLAFSPQTEGRKSIDESNPSSPISTAFAQRPEESRHSTFSAQSPTRKPKRLLGFGRSDGSKEVKSTESWNLNLEEGDRNLRRPSEEPVYWTTAPEVPLGDTNRSNGARPLKVQIDANVSSKAKGRDSREGREPDSAVRRFFKGGIIGDLVRGEVSKTTSLIRRKETWSDAPETQPPKVIEESDAELTSGSQGQRNDSKVIRILKQRSDSASRKSIEEPRLQQQKIKPRYHLELPSFRPTSSPRGSRPSTPEAEPRHNRNKDYEFSVPYSQSNVSLSRTSTQNTQASYEEDKRKRLLPAFLSSRAQSNSRLSSILDSPGLSSATALRTTSTTPRPPNQRQWSISDKPISSSSVKTTTGTITAAEVSRLRALLLCSGIKAAELVRRAETPASPPPDFLIEAAMDANVPLNPVPDIKVHRTAADLIITTLDKNSAVIHHSAEAFRATTVADLRTSLTDLRTKVTDRIERARLAGDDAVGFGALVTGQKTIEVQQVVIALDKFRRKRGRRLRFIRRVMFGLLEWGVTLFLWWVWLLVSIVKIFWRVFMGGVKVARWALWLN